jgi:hypothetical protein
MQTCRPAWMCKCVVCACMWAWAVLPAVVWHEAASCPICCDQVVTAAKHLVTPACLSCGMLAGWYWHALLTMLLLQCGALQPHVPLCLSLDATDLTLQHTRWHHIGPSTGRHMENLLLYLVYVCCTSPDISMQCAGVRVTRVADCLSWDPYSTTYSMQTYCTKQLQ